MAREDEASVLLDWLREDDSASLRRFALLGSSEMITVGLGGLVSVLRGRPGPRFSGSDAVFMSFLAFAGRPGPRFGDSTWISTEMSPLPSGPRFARSGG